MVLVTSACGEGSDEPACMHYLTRAFASRIKKVCKLKKTLNIFRHLVPLESPDRAIFRGFFVDM